MSELPLLLFRASGIAKRDNKPGANPRKPPSHAHQISRVQSALDNLFGSIENEREGVLSEFAAEAAPENVIVIRTVGSVENFYRAAKEIDGLEWLAEAEDEFAPDSGFYEETLAGGDEYEDRQRGQLYLTAANQEGINQLLSLWERYKADRAVTFERGQGPWKQLFALLHDIRRWGVEDRLNETGVIEAWEEDLQLGLSQIETEIILWFRNDASKRATAEQEISSIIAEVGGEILDRAVVPDIHYHAVLAKLPRGIVSEIIATKNAKLVRCESVMFFSPSGQSVGITPKEIEQGPDVSILESPQGGTPDIAILDGCPQTNHPHISRHVLLDDPDGWLSKYQVGELAHGTQMASLVVNGDLAGDKKTIRKPIYMRPVMLPNERDFTNPGARDVSFPANKLKVDLVYRAIRRIFEGDGDEPAAAPNVKILSLSLGDKNDVFLHFLSPWAKLLDWASWKYGVLIFVSAGNHVAPIAIDTTPDAFKAATIDERESIIMKSLHRDVRHRTILSPAEGINIITVGSAYHDNSGDVAPGPYQFEVMKSKEMPAPYSARGLGFRRSVKPDILSPGGRILFKEPSVTNGTTFLTPNAISTRAPGVLTSAPAAANQAPTIYQRGTSLANAIAVHHCGITLEVIEDLLRENEANIDRLQLVSLLKALSVHGSSWGDAGIKLKELLQVGDDHNKAKTDVARHLGYGAADFSRIIGCTEQRATILGWGAIQKDQGLIYELPLPPSLSSQKLWRRLTISLGWITPLNFHHRYHRLAQLWFDFDRDSMQVERGNSADWRMVRRGTIQHEVFEGDKATPFIDDGILKIVVNCAQDAGGLGKQTIPFGIAASIEVGEGVAIPVYQEVKAKLQIRPQVRSS